MTWLIAVTWGLDTNPRHLEADQRRLRKSHMEAFELGRAHERANMGRKLRLVASKIKRVPKLIKIKGKV